MSYSGHLGTSGYTSRGPHPGSGTRVFPTWRMVSLWIVVLVWLAFIATAFASPAVLTDIWEWAIGLPVHFQVILWVLALPWMIGLAVFESDLSAVARILVIAATAVISFWTFLPTRRSRGRG